MYIWSTFGVLWGLWQRYRGINLTLHKGFEAHSSLTLDYELTAPKSMPHWIEDRMRDSITVSLMLFDLTPGFCLPPKHSERQILISHLLSLYQPGLHTWVTPDFNSAKLREESGRML